MRKKPLDWSRRLPRLLVIPGVITLRTLADVRELIERHLPATYRDKATWRYVADRLAAGADIADDLVIPLRMVLAMEGVTCRLE
jgi:hypothetical protein